MWEHKRVSNWEDVLKLEKDGWKVVTTDSTWDNRKLYILRRLVRQ